MKKVLWVLSSLALVGMGFVGCDDDDSDACDNKCGDSQVCAPIKGGTHECVDVAKIGKKCKVEADSVVSIKNCYVLNKDASTGDYQCVIDDVNCTNYCYGDNDCASGSCDTAKHTCNAAAANNEYKYVRIDDLSTGTKSRDLGADIDAVVLTKKAGGDPIYAKNVVGFKRGDDIARNNKDTKGAAKVNASDPDKALDKPDSLIYYGDSSNADKADVCYYFKESSNSAGKLDANNHKICDSDDDHYCGGNDECDCDFDYTFVSLGGTGGYIVLEMGGAVEDGDKLDIIELGNCRLSNTGGKKASDGFGNTIGDSGTENIKVSVSLSRDAAAGDYKQLLASGKAAKGVVSIAVKADMLK